jgi:subfamily B ATP-binding cassette protein MsbA
MLNPLRHLAETNSQLQRGLAAAEGLFALLDEKEERNSGTTELTKAKGIVNFENVSFCYATRDTNALTNFNLEIPSGKTCAIVGPSGSGKSSLLALLPRLYDIDSGHITIDGINIKELTLASLRRQFALVSQDVVLFNDSIRNNISYGSSSYTDQDIRDAVGAADLNSFLMTLPKGIDTQVGDRGVRLSGGQRQRIAIARAILKNAPILLLDEATSALDTQSEIAVQRAVDKLRANRTTIVVAHRLSTVVDADLIVVLNGGKIVQKGKHADLMSEDGLYRVLYSTLKTESKIDELR